MKRVLIVDDDLDLLEMVCLTVRSNGMDPICVSSGQEALLTLATIQFDLILMDIFLGDKDGRELARQLKKEPRSASIPIILYSAGEITASSIAESMADAFIQKPFNISSLIHRMYQLMPA